MIQEATGAFNADVLIPMSVSFGSTPSTPKELDQDKHG
jgi:hypothetical protein